MDNWEERTQQEIAHQAARAPKVGEVKATPSHIVERYRANRLWWAFPKEFVFKCLGGPAGKKILDFGCGDGENATQLALLGASVTGLDISPELVEIARRRAELDGVQDRAQFIAADVTKSPLPEREFDCLLCYAVLHHIDFRSVLPRLIACLKPGGMAIALEPIAFSPRLQRLRDVIPVKKEWDPVQRQLNRDDVGFIDGCLADSHLSFYNLFGRLERLLPSTTRSRTAGVVKKAILILLGTLDRLLVTLFPFLSKFYGTVVIVGQKPSSREVRSACEPSGQP